MTAHTDLSPRELDAALAERLFGWAISQLEAPDGCPDFLEQWAEAHVPHYSTTGDGMLLVLEAMRERSRSIRLHWNDVGKVWVAWFSNSPWAPQAAGDLYADEVSDVAAPRAVALAVLEALEGATT